MNHTAKSGQKQKSTTLKGVTVSYDNEEELEIEIE
jgi:hypothetical protein